MKKQSNDIPNPFEYYLQLKKLEKFQAEQTALQKKIQSVIEGDKPTDLMSWEHYIWESHNNPLHVLNKRRR